MTTQPKDLMTLEEVIFNLQLCLQADVINFGGSSLIRKKEVGKLLASALHHLEAGRKDTERLDYIQESGHHLEKFKGLWSVVTDTEHGCIGDEQYVRNAIDAAMVLAPTAQEVKEEIC